MLGSTAPLWCVMAQSRPTVCWVSRTSGLTVPSALSRAGRPFRSCLVVNAARKEEVPTAKREAISRKASGKKGKQVEPVTTVTTTTEATRPDPIAYLCTDAPLSVKVVAAVVGLLGLRTVVQSILGGGRRARKHAAKAAGPGEPAAMAPSLAKPAVALPTTTARLAAAPATPAAAAAANAAPAAAAVKPAAPAPRPAPARPAVRVPVMSTSFPQSPVRKPDPRPVVQAAVPPVPAAAPLSQGQQSGNGSPAAAAVAAAAHKPPAAAAAVPAAAAVVPLALSAAATPVAVLTATPPAAASAATAAHAAPATVSAPAVVAPAAAAAPATVLTPAVVAPAAAAAAATVSTPAAAPAAAAVSTPAAVAPAAPMAAATVSRPAVVAPAAPVAAPSQPQEQKQSEAAKTGKLVLLSGAHMIPHPKKVAKGGEDAFMVAADGAALIVADGVGGWTQENVDPALYAQSFVERCAKALSKDGTSWIAGQELTARHLVSAMAFAQEQVKVPGSCTTCICALNAETRTLEVANLGDSGARVVRNGAVVFATQVMEHEANMPYQLAAPDVLPDTDSATDADKYRFYVEEGDVVLLGTDGLFDNLFDKQLAAMVAAHTAQMHAQGVTKPTAASAQLLALSVAAAAHATGSNTAAQTPWAAESAERVRQAQPFKSFLARLTNAPRPKGGKMDDVTVVAAIVASS